MRSLIVIGCLAAASPVSAQALNPQFVYGRDYAFERMEVDALIERAHAHDKNLKRDAALNDLKRALALAKTPEDKARVQGEIERLTQ